MAKAAAVIPRTAARLSIAAVVTYQVLLIALIFIRPDPMWAAARPVLLWTAGLPLLGFVAFAAYTAIFVVPLGPHAYGPGVHIGWPPRFAFFTYMVWLLVLSWQAIKPRGQNS